MSTINHSLHSIHAILKKNKPSNVCLVTSVHLAKKLKWAIKEIVVPQSHIILLSDGEKAKEWSELKKLLEKLSALNLDRKATIIALGGGTVGDITGFAASIYLRGIRYIQIPTTLLAQVDSAHGGKTGINFLGYKNQIGTFHSPIATIIEPRFLKSLSKEQIIDGLGEIIKAGLIHDRSILSLLRRHSIDSLIKSPDIQKIISKSIVVKDYFTNKDFNDTASRQILNVGHTLGHAIELKYKIGHGRAVLIGMLQELAFTESQKLTPPSVRKNLEALLNRLGIHIDTDMKADWEMIMHDKKITGSTIDFPVIMSEGKAKLVSIKLTSLKKLLY